MTRKLTLILSILLIAVVARSQTVDELNLMTLVAGDPARIYPSESYVCLYGHGQGEIHIIVINAENFHTGQPIARIGGFECEISLPPGVEALGQVLPPGSINFLTPPTFFVGGDIPVTGTQTLLGTLVVNVPPGEDATLPVSLTTVPLRYQSIPGHLAITDADDAYSISRAWSPSLAWQETEFWIVRAVRTGRVAGSPVFPGPCVVDDEDRSWGEVKAMFR